MLSTKIMRVLAIIFFSVGMIGCNDLLNQTPPDQISSANFWQSEQDLRLAANNLYNSLNSNAYIDTRSIDYYGKGPNNVSSGTNTVPRTDGVWSSAYTYIRRANDMLENIGGASIDQEVKDRYAAEARFFRAYNYFQLLKRYGDVPLILKTLDLESDALYKERTDRQKVTDQIIKDLQWAGDKLSVESELSSGDQGRITSGVALGFISRVTLYEGTRAKYHGYGNPDQLLQRARKAAQRVIQSGEYSLFRDFLGIFRERNENNSEVMLSVFYKEGVAGSGQSGRGRGLLIDARMAPTKYLADAFLAEDGLPIEHSDLFQGYATLESEFVGRDPRMSQTIWRPGTPFINNKPLVPDLTRTNTGYWPKKPGDPKVLEQTFIYTDFIVMRYAEILLNYAEATYELQGHISDEDLNISINKLRDRVGMPHLTNAFVNGNNPEGAILDMKEEIRRERRVELAGEGFRYDDLMRWETAETELPQPVLGAKFQEDQYPEG